MEIPAQTIERLTAYRRLLIELLKEGKERIFSHELAALEGLTSPQVRRDIMTIEYSGSPARGYDVLGLIARVSEVLDPPHDEGMALVGVGQLGKAILSYLSRARHHVRIVAAFDRSPDKVGRVINGCRCFSIDEMESVLRPHQISIGIICVPARGAQGAADRLIHAGVRGLANFAPVRLRLPADIYVEDLDISRVLEKMAYITRPVSSSSGGEIAP